MIRRRQRSAPGLRSCAAPCWLARSPALSQGTGRGMVVSQEIEQICYASITMTLGDTRESPLLAMVRPDTLLDLRRSSCPAGEIRLVDNHDVRQVEHRDLLKLKLAAVLGAGDEQR